MQVQIKFKRTGSNSVYGSFEAGDVLRCDSALAAHYVREGIALYTEAAPATAQEDAKPAPVKRSKRAK
jgi:hypothetical protein